MGANRNALLSEIKQAKDALRASEKRGRKAVTRMRELEKVLGPLLPKIENWIALPLSDDAPCRVITTGEARALLTLLRGGEAKDETEDEGELAAA